MKTETKRTIYIALFVVFGILLGTVIHGLIEMWYINHLLTDFAKYSFGHDWNYWFAVHKYFSIIIFLLSIIFGYFQGRLWWRLVYVEGKLDPFFKWLHKIFHLKYKQS